MKQMFVPVGAMLALIATGVALGLTLRVHSAYADPKPGLWQEATVTQTDGVTVRVIRDTTGGHFNVCYVASKLFPSTYGGPSHATVAISCVPERQP